MWGVLRKILGFRFGKSRKGERDYEFKILEELDGDDGVDDIIEFVEPEFIKDHLSAEDFLKAVPELSPEDMFVRLEEFGYRGQERARKVMCLAAYRHIKRLKLIYLKDVPRTSLPERNNYLLVGPTGCGKTYLVQLLFGKILSLPYIIVDATKFTESGYVGDDVITIVLRLLDKAGRNVSVAQLGVVVIDEFDKIAGSVSTARFAGQGTTKDVSGYGVQRELLKLLDGSEMNIPVDYPAFGGGRINFSTKDVMFVGVGAFSGIDSVRKSGENLGFGRKVGRRRSKVSYRLSDDEVGEIDRFFSYGFLPELVARFHRIVPFDPLGEKELREIFRIKIRKHIDEFLMEGFKVKLDKDVEDLVVKKALKSDTGARGIERELVSLIEDVAFNVFGKHLYGTLRFMVDSKGKIKYELQLDRKRA